MNWRSVEISDPLSEVFFGLKRYWRTLRVGGLFSFSVFCVGFVFVLSFKEVILGKSLAVVAIVG